jgi:Ca2+-binding RTX toxin-like protein
MLDLYIRGVVERSASTLRRGGRARRRGLGRRAQIESLEQRKLLSVSILNNGGLGYVGNGGGGPPDVTGAAGPNSYLEINNSTVTLFSPKPGGAILAQHNISDFFYNSAIGNQTVIDQPFSAGFVPIAAGPGGATEAGTTVTITTGASHGFSAGQNVKVSGVGVSGYNGTFTITGTPTPTTFTYTDATSGLAGSGGGNATVDGGSCGVCDSTGAFDNLMGASGRFLIGDIDIDNVTNVSQYLLAVSKTSNPTTFTTADWNFYNITTTEGPAGNSAWTDYPGNPGFNKDAVVETFNMFGSLPFRGNSQVVSIDASDLANGVSQASLRVYKNNQPGFSYRATQMQNAAPGDPMWLVRNPEDGTHVDVTKMTNVLSNSATFANTSLALPAAKNYSAGGVGSPLDEFEDDDEVPPVTYGDPFNPGNSPSFDIDNRILNASQYNNTLVAAQKVAVGTATLVNGSLQISNGNPVAGSGYTAGDVLNVNGGTFSTQAQLKVLTLGAGGSVATFSVATAGTYSSLSGVDGTVAGGSGSGAKFNLNFGGETDVQWYAVNVGGGSPAFQQVAGVDNVGRIGFGTNTYCVDPTVAINPAGEIGMGFMEVDTTGGAITPTTGGFLSTFVTARKSGDAAGAMQPPVLVPRGTGSGVINGRIGDFSGTNVDPLNGTFWHVNEFGGGGPTVIANFTPEDKPVVTAPGDQTAVEGASQVLSLGSFIDADGSPWTVKVAWGDGTTDTFTTAAAGSLGTRTHTYAEEGSNVVTVTVTDSTTLSDSKTFNVAVSDPGVVPTAVAVNAVEGQATGSVAVATFTDPGGSEPVGDYSASINWGDSTAPTSGTITFSAGTFTVSGNHTYAEESAGDHPDSNPYMMVVTILHESAPSATAKPSATVSDPAVVATGGFNFIAVEGVPSATQTVATFTDPGGAEVVTDYSAMIDWGDGTAPTPGALNLSSGVYTVMGAHTYASGLGLPDDFGNSFCDAGPPHYNKPITVTISHESAPTSVANSSATISLAPDSAHLAGGSLIVVGTTGDDTIHVDPVGNTGAVQVYVNNGSLGMFTLASTGRIIVAAMAGNDDVQIAGGVRLNTVLYGATGNDRLKGGGGRNILVGCDGDDFLIGGNAGDLLIGGQGSDRIVGGQGADILVSGNIVDPALNEDTKFSDLVAVLNGGPVHALADTGQDTLTGGGGADAFYYHFLGISPFDKLTGNGGLTINI